MFRCPNYDEQRRDKQVPEEHQLDASDDLSGKQYFGPEKYKK